MFDKLLHVNIINNLDQNWLILSLFDPTTIIELYQGPYFTSSCKMKLSISKYYLKNTKSLLILNLSFDLKYASKTET